MAARRPETPRPCSALLLGLVAARLVAAARLASSPADAVQLLQTTAGVAPAETAAVAPADEDVRPNSRPRPRSAPARRRFFSEVLIFWAVSSKPAVQELVRRNVEHARSYEGEGERPLRFDVYLAHYDHRQSDWMADPDAERWYKDNVRYSWQKSGIKFRLAQELLTDTRVDLRAYDWLWILDEDADFRRIDLTLMLQDAQESGSVILTPAIIANDTQLAWNSSDAAKTSLLSVSQEVSASSQSGCQPADQICNFQAPHRSCRYRYVNFIEVSFPLVRPKAFQAVRANCRNCFHRQSIWGLDHVWCRLAASAMKVNETVSCAILDRAGLIHQNFKTLSKWEPDATPGYREGDWTNFQAVRSFNSKYWVQTYRQHQCVGL